MAKSSSISQEAIIRLISRSDRLIEAGTKIGVAYLGYQANNHWTGALTSLIALKLAQSGNVVAGAAGVSVLGIIGLTNITKKTTSPFGIIEPPPGVVDVTLRWMPSVKACTDAGGTVQAVAPLGDCHCWLPK